MVFAKLFNMLCKLVSRQDSEPSLVGAVCLSVVLTLRLSFKASYSANSIRASSGMSLEAASAAAAAALEVPLAQSGCGDSGVLAPAARHEICDRSSAAQPKTCCCTALPEQRCRP